MSKKAVIDPLDFDKIFEFITRHKYKIADAEAMVELKNIFKRVQIIELPEVDKVAK